MTLNLALESAHLPEDHDKILAAGEAFIRKYQG